MELKFIKEFDFKGIEIEFDHAFWSYLVGWNWNGIVKGFGMRAIDGDEKAIEGRREGIIPMNSIGYPVKWQIL